MISLRRRFIDQPVVWFIPAVTFILIFAMAARTPLDSDMWWHLRAGEAAVLGGKPLLQDTFSFTRFGQHWINHSWLAQAGMFLLYRGGGFLALGLATALLTTLSLALVYPQMEGGALLRAFVLVLAATVAAPVWSPRPQLASLVFLSALMYVLYLFKWRGQERLWLLPLIFMIWSNLHGGYVLGFLAIIALAAGETLNHLLGREGSEVISWKRILRLVGWGLVAVLAAGINPNGVATWSIPFKTVGIGALQDSIAEWSSPDFHHLAQQPFFWMLVATLGAAGLSIRRLDGSDLVCVVGFAYLAILARRNFGPFALVAAPVLARHLSNVLAEQHALHAEKWLVFDPGMRMNSKVQPGGHARLILNLLLVTILALVAIGKMILVSSPAYVAREISRLYPSGAVAWIAQAQPDGNLFNEYNWGGYLVWTLPDYPVFVDGRTDLFDQPLLEAYQLTNAGVPGWQDRLDQFGINLALVENGSGLARQLALSPAWENTYTDELAKVYIRRAGGGG